MAHPIREAIAAGRICRHLRTKAMFVIGDDGPPADYPHPPSTACFWCNESGWAMGPDLEPANPDRCAANCGRACYRGDASA